MVEKLSPFHPRIAGRLLDGEQERQEWSAGEDRAEGLANDDMEEMTGYMRNDQQAAQTIEGGVDAIFAWRGCCRLAGSFMLGGQSVQSRTA